MKKLTVRLFLILLILFMTPFPLSVSAEDTLPFDVNAQSAVLMEATTGTVLYSKNGNTALPPASVTKVMTLLLIMEQVDSGSLPLDEMITVSDYAASMGGSQVYLEPGETLSAEELIKCVVIASANDAAVALAERVGGNETAFVQLMNEKAEKLGLENSHFENVTGLDDETVNHVMSAYDIAVISRELMRHKKIFDFSTVWMDSIRNGSFGLTNTNRLIRFYKGATGLKSGSTAKAKFCISATAESDGEKLIAVIMGSETRDTRNEAAKQLLDWGFATYAVYQNEGGIVGKVEIRGGKVNEAYVVCPSFVALIPKSKAGRISPEYVMEQSVAAPVKKGETIGEVRYVADGEVISSSSLTVSQDVPRIGFFDVFTSLLRSMLLK